VAVAAATPRPDPVATFGSGSTALTVQMSARARAQAQAQAEAERQVQEAQGRSQEEQVRRQEEQRAARRAFGSMVAGVSSFTAPSPVLETFRDGGVDMRVLVVLGSLCTDYSVTVADVPVAGGEDPVGVARHQVLITFLDHRPIAAPEIAAALTQWLAPWAQPFAPSEVTLGPSGLLLSWASPAPGA
jgi:hypothetical protein